MPPKIDQKLEELPYPLRFRPHPATDMIDMEFVIQELEQSARAQVIAATFETSALVYKARAEGAAKIARIIGGAQRE